MPVFYDCTTAPSPRRARIVLAEKGIAHEVRQIDLASGEQLSDAYRAINPACTVPALVLDDGAVLTDNAGIAAWAEAVQGEPPLLGTTPLEKAQVASWNSKIEGECFMAIAEVLRNKARGMVDRALPGPNNYAQIPELAERGRARLTHFLDRFEQHMTGRDWVAIDSFSLADITAGVALDFAGWVKVDVNEGRPGIAAWRAKLAQRPSFAI
ncbi:glutathione S-transferase family protein [Novosphingobium sp.]|uniref:glutathione S-transferase family protein n=1 Tax=Novosphingobium sp. TaxID=1874826 RepID=UPI0025F7D5E3|nr:glutathione S-transferase family protein [Novosphingobium sp.]MCC6924833.1 glutathione S-transferase family protein [Novosphingobium sp.]